jgi:hypothetical protein
MGKVSQRRFCAFCRSERLVYLKKHVSIEDVLLSLAASVLFSIVIFQDLDPRIAVFFVIGIAMAELFISLRWRVSISCPHCGFDPVLYKKTPDAAAKRVKNHLDVRRADPFSAVNPPPRLPVIVKKFSADQLSSVTRKNPSQIEKTL